VFLEVAFDLIHGHLVLKVTDNKVNSDDVRFAVGNNDVDELHDWLDKLIIGCLDESIILGEYTLYRSSSFSNVPLYSPLQSDIVISHHKHFQVHQLSEPLLIECHDSFEDKEWLALNLLDLIHLSIIRQTYS
jgi:hypothetical protein